MWCDSNAKAGRIAKNKDSRPLPTSPTRPPSAASRGGVISGVSVSSAWLAVARQTVERCVARISQLYERGAAASRIGTYVQRWRHWVRAGLGGAVTSG